MIVPAGGHLPATAPEDVTDPTETALVSGETPLPPLPDPAERTIIDPRGPALDERTRVMPTPMPETALGDAGQRRRPAFPPREEMPTIQWRRGEEHTLGLPTHDLPSEDEEVVSRPAPSSEKSSKIIVDVEVEVESLPPATRDSADSLAPTMLPPEAVIRPGERHVSHSKLQAPAASSRVPMPSPPPGQAPLRRFDQAPEDLVILAAPDSQAAAQFRVLRFKLEERPSIRSVVVTSPQEGEGKTSVALNLALAMAEGGKRRVALVEGDLRTPRLGEMVGLSQGAPGVTELIAERKMMPDEPLRLYPIVRGLELLPAGQPSENPASILGSAQLAQIFEELLGFYHYIIVDTPPVLRYADANLVQGLVDAILVVARVGISRTDMIHRAVQRLPRQKILGTILTGVDPKHLATT